MLPHQKRMPSLKSLQIPEREQRQQTWRQQMQVARMWTVALGGTVH